MACTENLFLVLQCFAGLAVEVDWFESLTSLSDHFENFEVEDVNVNVNVNIILSTPLRAFQG